MPIDRSAKGVSHFEGFFRTWQQEFEGFFSIFRAQMNFFVASELHKIRIYCQAQVLFLRSFAQDMTQAEHFKPGLT